MEYCSSIKKERNNAIYSNMDGPSELSQKEKDKYREICMQVRKQQLELDMEQQTGSK